jgi:hypothetical protein
MGNVRCAEFPPGRRPLVLSFVRYYSEELCPPYINMRERGRARNFDLLHIPRPTDRNIHVTITPPSQPRRERPRIGRPPPHPRQAPTRLGAQQMGRRTVTRPRVPFSPRSSHPRAAAQKGRPLGVAFSGRQSCGGAVGHRHGVDCLIVNCLRNASSSSEWRPMMTS